MTGLVIGKPLGFVLASALVVWWGLAQKPSAYSWRQLTGAGALAGIGFTMSLFIAGQAFPVPSDFAAAKIAVFAASVLSALIGVAILWNAQRARGGRGRLTNWVVRQQLEALAEAQLESRLARESFTRLQPLLLRLEGLKVPV